MIGETSFYGIYIPWLLLLAVVALGVLRVLSIVLAHIGFYRLVWHPALFDFALFVIVLACLSIASSHWF